MVWTLRTCALYGNNLTLLTSLGTCGLAVVVILSVNDPPSPPTTRSFELTRAQYRVPLMSCEGGKDISILLGVNAAIVVFIELVTFSLATWHIRKALRIENNVEADSAASFMQLHHLMLAQGFYYIFAVFAFAIAQLFLNFRWKTGFLARLVNAIKVPLSGLLTARFMLQLRKYSYKTTLDEEIHITQWDSVCDEFNGEITFNADKSGIDKRAGDDGVGYGAEVEEHLRQEGTCEAHRTVISVYSLPGERGSEQNV
ncbi:hypothetical protein BKA70DRAFT_1339503 [Coprinopsis sp. MPI-PUGE-AT-0042]|nr:hypothetical protein BKA70DRAFT_1339503 [Coprinopsis sp. MPI-PUGE-AT-0042]